MYQSTPQHVIDEESHPGVLAEMLNSSSSSDTSSSSDSDSDSSSGSHKTSKRLKRAFRGRRRRKSNASSKEASSLPSAARSPSEGTFSDTVRNPSDTTRSHNLGVITSGDEADLDGEIGDHVRSRTARRDFELEKIGSGSKATERRHQKKSNKKSRNRLHNQESKKESGGQAEDVTSVGTAQADLPRSPRVAFVQDTQAVPDSSTKRPPFLIRGLSVRPSMPKVLTQSVFSAANDTGVIRPGVDVPRAPYGLRRTTSLPDRLNQAEKLNKVTSGLGGQPAQVTEIVAADASETDASPMYKHHISRTSAIILLLVSTALVAVCAEFLVGSINYLVAHTDVKQVRARTLDTILAAHTM